MKCRNTLLALIVTTTSLSACLPYFADTPEDLTIGVITTSLNDEGKISITEEKANEAIEEASTIWAQCGISFMHAGHLSVSAAALGLPTSATDEGMLEDIQNEFYTDNYISIIFIPRIMILMDGEAAYVGGRCSFPWSPGDAIAIDKSAAVGQGVVPHEIGHYLGLPHTHEDGLDSTGDNDFRNVMFQVGTSVSVELNPAQCEIAKSWLLYSFVFSDLCRPLSAEGRQYCVPPSF